MESAAVNLGLSCHRPTLLKITCAEFVMAVDVDFLQSTRDTKTIR